MAAKWELKEKSSGELTFTVEGDEWKRDCDKAFNKIAAGMEMKGFRKGQVPKSIVEKKVTRQQVQYQAVEDNANDWLVKAVDETGIKMVSRPTLDVRSVDDDHAEVVFKAVVEPEFEVGKYKDLEYKVASTEVTPEEFDKEMSRMRESFADVQTKDGAAEKGDTVNINYEGFKDGKPFEGGKADNYNLELGSNSFIPGFEDQLIGAKAGDEKELNLTFPEDYHEESLKGAAVVFKVKVNEVKTKVLPEVDDDFAKDVNAPGVETADQLKDLIHSRIELGKKEQAEQAADNELAEKLTSGTEVEIPDEMIQSEVQNLIAQLSQQVSQYGMNLKQYLGMIGQTAEQMAKGYEEQAKKNVKLRLILDKIAKIESLEPSLDEIESEVKELSTMYNMTVEQIKGQIDSELIKDDLRRRKAYDFVKANVVKVTGDAADKKADQAADTNQK